MRIGSTWQEFVRRGVSKVSGARDKTRLGKSSLQELFPDVGQTYVDWDLTYGNAPDERPSLWRTNGAWEVTSDRETPSMGMIHMAHCGPLPPIWDLLDKPSNESLPLA
jgi:hypothetical protein